MSDGPLPKPFVTVTPSGVFILWISLLSIPCGIFLYSGILLILGLIGLALLGVSRHIASKQLRHLRLFRRLPKRGFTGEAFEIEARIENTRNSMTSREIVLDDKLAGHSGSAIQIVSHAPQITTTKTYPAKVFQRGKIQVPDYQLTSQWPFGFFRAVLTARFQPMAEGDDTLLIAPKPVIPVFIDRILQQIEQEAVLFSEYHPDDPTAIRSLRQFRSGDSVKAIHWPASSRSGSIIVREFDPPHPKPQRHGIFLHQYVPPGELNQPDRFEKILRIASGLLVHFWQRNLSIVARFEFAETQIFQIPEKSNYHQALDTLAEALSAPTANRDFLDDGWDIFKSCDQVFVLGHSNRKRWQSATEGKHPSPICIDPESGGFQSKRKARMIKPTGKILTR